MKSLPTAIASASRDTAVELLAFEGSDPIPNRDAVGLYLALRLQPSGEPSRLAVLFSGTVLAVRPEAFGLPSAGDRDSSLQVFAQAAVGDSLDESTPPFTPGGVAAAKIECFSPHFQSWRDRQPASDDTIEEYLFSHCIWAWKYGQESWTIGLSDLLRLNQPLTQVLRIVRLYEGEAWTIQGENAQGPTLTPTPAFLRKRVDKRYPPSPGQSEPSVAPELTPAAFVYVDEARIAELRRLNTGRFDFTKLIALCEELNQCYRAQCYHAVAALTRAVVDHVPPVFDMRTFAEVANNYAGTRSFKECVRRLDETGRKIADAHLHTPIRESEALPTRVQVNFSNELDVLLAEVIRLLQG